MKELIAYGKDIHGKTHEFTIEDGYLNCEDNQLTELTIPMGVKKVYCYDNQLTELIIPEGVESIACWGNQLTELILPEGVKRVACSDNQITYLDLPESFRCLIADKKVKGLERYIGKLEMELV